MKVADLLNEHGLKWFRGSQTLFGILWGVFGAWLVFLDPVIANIVLAMNVAFLLRNRLDYFNHQLAATIIIVAFLYNGTFLPHIFIGFLLISYVFGSLKDIFDDRLKKQGFVFKLTESALYYPIPTFIYSWITGKWYVFVICTLWLVSYNIVKSYARKKGYA